MKEFFFLLFVNYEISNHKTTVLSFIIIIIIIYLINLKSGHFIRGYILFQIKTNRRKQQQQLLLLLKMPFINQHLYYWLNLITSNFILNLNKVIFSLLLVLVRLT